MPFPLRTLDQKSASHSPWAARLRLKVALWNAVRVLLFKPTPKPMHRWRLLLLRAFGTRVTGRPFVDASCVVKMPWNLAIDDLACIGAEVKVYNLARITLGARCVVAQEVYLCAGTHDFSSPVLPLMVGEIAIGEDAFVGVRAVVLPGLVIGAGAVVGAGAIVTRDVPDWTVSAGNPARPIGARRSPKRGNPSTGP